MSKLIERKILLSKDADLAECLSAIDDKGDNKEMIEEGEF